jgi:hypothetical protein
MVDPGWVRREVLKNQKIDCFSNSGLFSGGQYAPGGPVILAPVILVDSGYRHTAFFGSMHKLGSTQKDTDMARISGGFKKYQIASLKVLNGYGPTPFGLRGCGAR